MNIIRTLSVLLALTVSNSSIVYAVQCDYSVTEEGAIGNNSHDDTDAINAAIATLKSTHPNASTLCFPSQNGGYKVNSTISFPSKMSVLMNAPIIYSGSSDQPVIELGEEGISTRNMRYRILVKNNSSANWGNENFIGLKINNIKDSNIEIIQSEGFTIGTQLYSDIGNGIGYNKITLGSLLNNKIGLDLTSFSDGWVNENLFYNGHFQVTSGINVNESRYGIRFSVANAIKANNNKFIKPSFELNASDIAHGQSLEALPILIQRGVMNSFESCRDEGNGVFFARVENDSELNEFDIGRDGKANPSKILDLSDKNNSFLTTRRTRIINSKNLVIFNSGSLHNKANYFTNSGEVYIPGFHFVKSTDATPLYSTNLVSINDNNIEIQHINRGLGVFVDTRNEKNFVVRWDSDSEFPARIAIRTLDESGEPLYSSTSPYVSGSRDFSSTSFANAYMVSTAIEEKFLYFSVTTSVKSVQIIIAPTNSANLKLNNFSIASTNGPAAVWSGLNEVINGAALANETPTTSCSTGEIRFNVSPTASGKIGWVCVDGNWKSFGGIDL